MWSIHDDDAPIVAETFYATLLREGRREDGTMHLGYAMHAVIVLYEKVGVQNFDRWVPFVHFGL